MSSAKEFAPITTASIEAEPPLQKPLLPTRQPTTKSSGMESSMIPPQQLQPASYTYSVSSSLLENSPNARDLTKKPKSPSQTSRSIYEQQMRAFRNISPSTDEPAHSAFKSPSTVAVENMPQTIHSNGFFSTMFPLLDDSALEPAVQATASLQYYNSPYNHPTPTMLSPHSFVDLGSMIAPGLPLRSEHAASPAIQQRLLNMRDNRARQKSQNISTDPSDLASHELLSASKAFDPHRPSFSSHIINPTISEEFKAADGHVPCLHRDSQKISIEDNNQRSHSSHDMAMPLQSLPARKTVNLERFVDNGKESLNARQMCPRSNTEPERTSTPAVSLNSQSRKSLDPFAIMDASPSPVYNTYASSVSVSPEGQFAWSPQQTNSTPASELYSTSKANTPRLMTGEQTKMLSTENTSQNSIPTPASNPRKRKLSHGEGLHKECESSTIIPVDVKSGSHLQGQRREKEREASARYRQKKKARKSAEPPEQKNKSVATSNDSTNAKYCGTGSINLAPPTSTEMALSSSQQSFSSIHTSSTQVSTSSNAPKMSSQGTSCDEWPNLPELHSYERRNKISYGPLAPYGSAETIQSYPPSFQASLHRVMDFAKIQHLQSLSHRVLFVYGSLMMSDLSHDIFETPSEWIFFDKIIKQCMCPARVPGYSRFAVHRSDEAVMMKADKGPMAVSTHGMLIFGLKDKHFRVLDRYLARGFVQEEVLAYVHLKSSSINFPVSAYVWPRPEMRPKGVKSHVQINEGVEWSVPRFWHTSRLCHAFRATMIEKMLRDEARREGQADAARDSDMDVANDVAIPDVV